VATTRDLSAPGHQTTTCHAELAALVPTRTLRESGTESWTAPLRRASAYQKNIHQPQKQQHTNYRQSILHF
jgi:hypothetical protein